MQAGLYPVSAVVPVTNPGLPPRLRVAAAVVPAAAAAAVVPAAADKLKP